jgi:hypothetical protein
MDLAVLDFLIPLNTDYLHWGCPGRLVVVFLLQILTSISALSMRKLVKRPE